MSLTLCFLPLLMCLAAFFGCKSNQGGTSKEAPTIIFRNADGRTLTMDDLRGATGTVHYEIFGREGVPAEAELLHEQARRAGGAGDYKKAVVFLVRASQLAPRWPYPVYDMAYTSMLTKDFDSARPSLVTNVDVSSRGTFTRY